MRMGNRAHGVLPFLCVAALAAAGCGESVDDGPGTMAGVDGTNGAGTPIGMQVNGTPAENNTVDINSPEMNAGGATAEAIDDVQTPQGSGSVGAAGDATADPMNVNGPADGEPMPAMPAVEMPTDAEDSWVSYGNGPKAWFANFGEKAIGRDTVEGLELKWMIDSEVTSPPVVVGSRLWVTTGEDGLYALNIEDGSEIWHDPSVSSFSAPTYDASTGTIYVNRWEGGVLHAFNADDGTLLWSSPISDQDAVRGWSSPVLAGDLLLVGIASSDRGTVFKGGLAAFDLKAQALAWTYLHAEEQAAGVAIWGGPSVDVESNMVFAGSGNNYSLVGAHSDSLFGVDMGAGTLMWNEQTAENDRWAYDCITCGPDHDFGSNPVLLEYEGRELLAAGQKSGSFWMLDRTTGEVLWEKKVSTRTHAAYGGVLNNGAFDGTRLLVAGNEGSRPGTLYALDPDPEADGRVLWERPLTGLVLAPITVANGLAYVPVGMTLEVVECETGTTVKVLEAGASVAGAAAVAQGHVFFGSGLSYYDNGAQPGAFYAYGL